MMIRSQANPSAAAAIVAAIALVAAVAIHAEASPATAVTSKAVTSKATVTRRVVVKTRTKTKTKVVRRLVRRPVVTHATRPVSVITLPPTTPASTTAAPIAAAPTTVGPTTTTVAPTTVSPTTVSPTTVAPAATTATTTTLLPIAAYSAAPTSAIVSAGQSASFLITPSRLGITTTYLVSGVPNDTNVVFTPNPSFGAVTLTVMTATTTIGGTYPLTISGVGPTGTNSVGVVLTVGSTNGLTASPVTQTVSAGSSATYAILANGIYVGVVLSFSAVGLPSGTAATFSPPSSSTGTVLTVAPPVGTPPGTYQFSVYAVGPAATLLIPLQLMVSGSGSTVASFGLALTPATASVAIGQSLSYTFAITPQGGFFGAIALTVAGLPANATAAFVTDSNTPSSASGRMIVSVAPNTPRGSSILVVTGSGNGLTASITVGLTVT